MYTLLGELLVHAYDMGLEQMITEGKEKNLLQGFVTLDREHEDNCSSVTIGLYKHFKQWIRRAVERKSAYLNYTPKDATAFSLKHYRLTPC